MSGQVSHLHLPLFRYIPQQHSLRKERTPPQAEIRNTKAINIAPKFQVPVIKLATKPQVQAVEVLPKTVYETYEMDPVPHIRRPRMRDDDSKEIEVRKKLRKIEHLKQDVQKIPEDTHLYFEKLPLELLQKIGHNIPDDLDLNSFKNSCQDCFDAIDKDQGSFWRERFLETYDPPTWLVKGSRCYQNGQYRTAYKTWQAFKFYSKMTWSSFGVEFAKTQANKMVEVVKVMMIDAMAAGLDISKNKSAIEQIFKAQNLDIAEWIHLKELDPKQRHAEHLGGMTTNPEYNIIQTFLAPAIFSASVKRWKSAKITHEEMSQMMDKFFHKREICDLSTGTVDFEVLLQHVSYWRLQLCCHKERWVTKAFEQLPPSMRPQQWAANSQDREQDWVMTQTYDNLNVFPGEDCEYPFFDVKLTKLEDSEEHVWPEMFERELPTMIVQQNDPYVIDRTKCERIAGTQCINNSDKMKYTGWIVPLPAQSGMQGWKRVVTVSYIQDELTGLPDFDILEAFAGVMLPNGQMVIGDLFHIVGGSRQASTITGPMIYWRV